MIYTLDYSDALDHNEHHFTNPKEIIESQFRIDVINSYNVGGLVEMGAEMEKLGYVRQQNMLFDFASDLVFVE